MSEWIYFIHAPREDFPATMTPDEEAVWAQHFERLKSLHEQGTVLLAGPTLGEVNTGIVVFRAEDAEAAEALMAQDPVVGGGWAEAELRPFRVSLFGDKGGVE